MKVVRVETFAGFEALRPLWGELARESGQSSPFLSHDWFACCWRLHAMEPPEVLLVEDAAGPVGLVPLMRGRSSFRRLPVRTLGPLMSPDTALADWLLVGQPDSIVDAVMAHLSKRRDWDMLSLEGFPVDSAVLKSLQAWLTGHHLKWERSGGVPSPYVVVTGSWEEFWAATSQRFKKTIRSVRNRLMKAGVVTVEEHRKVDGRSAIFADLLEVSQRSWKADHGVAIATMPAMPEFFGELTERASANDWLHLWILRLNGRAVATEYQLQADGRVYALRADFDGSLPDELSPGTHLSCEILRALFDRDDVHEYNLGPGDNPYKARWTSQAHESVRLRIFREGLYGRLLHGVEFRVLPALRRLRDGRGSR